MERQSRFTLLVKVIGEDTRAVVAALTRQEKDLPKGLRRSLTWDWGMELENHQQFTMETDVAVYFCTPRSPW